MFVYQAFGISGAKSVTLRRWYARQEMVGEEIRSNENGDVGHNAKVRADRQTVMRQTGKHISRQTHRNETADTDRDIQMGKIGRQENRQKNRDETAWQIYKQRYRQTSEQGIESGRRKFI